MINFVFMLNTLLIIGVIHMKFKSEKNSGLNKVRTHDLIDTGAVLYRLSYRAILMLRLYTCEYMKDHKFHNYIMRLRFL